jgi:hypothetical protein
LSVGLRRFAGLLLSLTLGLTACTTKTTTAEDVTNRVIRAIDAGDLQQTLSTFDSSVRGTMTPASFDSMSRLMRSFGAYQSVREISVLPNGRYDLEANFEDGSMLVQLRLNPAGQIAAFHVIPNVLHSKP